MKALRFIAAIFLIVLVLIPVSASAASILVLAPGAFSKTSPANGAAVMSLSPTLSWGMSSNATGYEYCYGLTSTNPCDGNWISNGASTTGQLSGLIANTTYYWQVRAKNTSLTPTYADGSETAVWSFTTGNLTRYPFKSKGAQDGWILESSETSGRGGTLNYTLPTFNIGDDKSRKQYRAILSFDTTILSSTATLSRVTLKLKKAGTSGTNPFAMLGNLVVDVRKGAFSNNPNLQYADFQAPVSRAAVFTFTNKLVGGWFVKSMNPAYFGYINRNGLTQFRLHFAKDDDNDSIADYLKIYSGNATINSYRPVLEIEYYEP